MSTDTPNDIKIGIKIEVDRKSIEEVQNQLRELAELTDLSTIRSKTKVPDMSKEVKQVTLFAKGAEKAESSINNLQNSIASTTLSPLNQETKIASNLEKDKNVVDELKSAIYSEAVTEQKTSDQVISNTNKEIQINKQLQGEISKVVNLKSQIDTNPKQLRFGDTGELTELSRQTVLFAEESKKADKEVTNLQNTIAKTNVSPLNQDTKIGDSVSVDNGIIKERIRLANEIITLNKQATDIAITNNKAEIESLKSLQTEINNTINAKKELINKEAEKVSQPTNLKGPISVGAITGETKPTNEGNGTTVADAITNLIDHYIQLAEQKKTNDKESEELKNRELERLAQLRKSHIENIEIASKGVKEQAPIDLTQTRVIIEAAKAMHSTEAILKQREGDYKELIVESKNYGNQTEEERKLSDELFKSKYQLNSEQTKLAKTYSIVSDTSKQLGVSEEDLFRRMMAGSEATAKRDAILAAYGMTYRNLDPVQKAIMDNYTKLQTLEGQSKASLDDIAAGALNSNDTLRRVAFELHNITEAWKQTLVTSRQSMEELKNNARTFGFGDTDEGIAKYYEFGRAVEDAAEKVGFFEIAISRIKDTTLLPQNKVEMIRNFNNMTPIDQSEVVERTGIPSPELKEISSIMLANREATVSYRVQLEGLAVKLLELKVLTQDTTYGNEVLNAKLRELRVEYQDIVTGIAELNYKLQSNKLSFADAILVVEEYRNRLTAMKAANPGVLEAANEIAMSSMKTKAAYKDEYIAMQTLSAEKVKHAVETKELNQAYTALEDRQKALQVGMQGWTKALSTAGNSLLWVGLSSMFAVMSFARLQKVQLTIEKSNASLRDSYISLIDAHKKYIEEIEIYGKTTEEGKRASLEFSNAQLNAKIAEDSYRDSILQTTLAGWQFALGMVPSLISASTQMTNVIWQSFAATTASTSSQITNTSVTGASIGVTNAATISVFGLSIAYWKLALAIGAVTFGINFAIMAGAMAVATAEADKQINKLRKDVNGLELSATSTEEAMGFEHSLGKVIVQVGKVADNTSQKISNLNNEILNAGKNSEIKANIEYVVNDKLPEVNQIVNTQVEKEIQLKINDIDKIIQPQTNDILNNIQLQSNNIQMEQLETLVIIKSLISEVNNQLSAVNYIKSIDNGFNITKIIETIVSLVATKQTPITDSINKLNQTKQENNLNDIANYTSETAYDTKKLNELSYINNNTESLKTMDLTKGPLLSSIERSNELLYLIHETLAAKHTLHVAVENTPDIGSEMGKTKSVGNNVQVIINGKFEIRNDLDISKVADEIGNQVMKKMYSTRGRY